MFYEFRLLKRFPMVQGSPRTVSVTRTSTDPSRFLATHSYSAVSSFWALLILREPLDRLDKRWRPCRGRPCRDHSTAGVGSPSAWQLSTTVVPASTTVSAGSTLIVGAPEDGKRHLLNSSGCAHEIQKDTKANQSEAECSHDSNLLIHYISIF